MLRAALEGLLAADHLGCVLHCVESIAASGAQTGEYRSARDLFGHVKGLRTSMRPLRHPLADPDSMPRTLNPSMPSSASPVPG